MRSAPQSVMAPRACVLRTFSAVSIAGYGPSAPALPFRRMREAIQMLLMLYLYFCLFCNVHWNYTVKHHSFIMKCENKTGIKQTAGMTSFTRLAFFLNSCASFSKRRTLGNGAALRQLLCPNHCTNEKRVNAPRPPLQHCVRTGHRSGCTLLFC